jgi:hypothetical protein
MLGVMPRIGRQTHGDLEDKVAISEYKCLKHGYNRWWNGDTSTGASWNGVSLSSKSEFIEPLSVAM